MSEQELETKIRLALLRWEDETAQGLVKLGLTDHVCQLFSEEGPLLYMYRREALVEALVAAVREAK
jgi:hypothetical protein